MTIREQLIKEVNSFQEKTGMSDCALGLQAACSPNIIKSLRENKRHPRIDVADRIFRFIKDYKIAKK